MIQSKRMLIFLMVILVMIPGVSGAADVQPGQKAVLVTGATSGIGLKVTEYLSAAGHFVYAGARKDKDMERLNAMDNVMAVRLDVTIQDQIDAAVATITAEGRGLYAVVNNAGVAIFGPIVETTDDDFNWQMDVNIYGVFRVTKAFAPMIVESKGRITTIGSISGTLSPGGLGAYSMTKHAMEAFTDALAAEMEPAGVAVNVVEPGNYKSRISERAFDRISATMKNSGRELSDDEKEWLEEGPNDRSQYKDPDEVAEAVMKALFDENPARRYMVVPNQGEAAFTIGTKVRELVQLNGDQPYTYDREALIEMLDRELEALGK
jgi:NAD(P)-dependent dehydrogenase (short-subunit alcohol dehydrogenase family)